MNHVTCDLLPAILEWIIQIACLFVYHHVFVLFFRLNKNTRKHVSTMQYDRGLLDLDEYIGVKLSFQVFTTELWLPLAVRQKAVSAVDSISKSFVCHWLSATDCVRNLCLPLTVCQKAVFAIDSVSESCACHWLCQQAVCHWQYVRKLCVVDSVLGSCVCIDSLSESYVCHWQCVRTLCLPLTMSEICVPLTV